MTIHRATDRPLHQELAVNEHLEELARPQGVTEEKETTAATNRPQHQELARPPWAPPTAVATDRPQHQELARPYDVTEPPTAVATSRPQYQELDVTSPA